MNASIAPTIYTNPSCICSGRAWLCEQHPDQPFEHEINGKVCKGPGDPCHQCNVPTHHVKHSATAKPVVRSVSTGDPLHNGD